MKISRIDIYKFNIRLTHPTVVPIGILDAANNVIIRIGTDSGLMGWGEASPFAPITGDTQESAFDHARLLAMTILGKDPLAVDARTAEISAETVGETSLRSAFDMALYDLLGQAAGLPLYALFGGERRALRTDFTIGMQDSVAQTLERVEECVDMGFDEIKLKVGRPGLADVEHVAAVRKLVGPEIAIKVDSNQGWDYPAAVANLRAMEPLGLQYSEQPLAAWNYEDLRRLRDKVAIPICADESVFNDRDALKLVSMGAVDYLNIKLGKSAGLGTALRIESIARAAGNSCMIGCFAESRLGLTAAAHLASARPNIRFLDLDSAYDFDTDPVEGGIIYADEPGGSIVLPDGPGLGATIKEDFLSGCEHYCVSL
jgi:L-alanine-DL-glutamate epimerase-like enolase superfamily enzyme